MTVTCPNCGKTLQVPDSKPTNGKCSSCGVSFTVEYTADETAIASIRVEKTFWKKHPKITKGFKTILGIGFLAGVTWLAVKPKIDEFTDDSPIVEDNQSDITSTAESYVEVSDNEAQENTTYTQKEIPVSGGKVKLSGNRRASQKKRETAAENGYADLAPDETWRVSSTRVIETSVKEP